MSKKHKKVCTNLNYIEPLLILSSAVIGFVSISASTSLVCIPVDILKNHKLIIKKKRSKRDEILLLLKLNSVKVKLNVLIMSRTRFRVNLHSILA